MRLLCFLLTFATAVSLAQTQATESQPVESQAQQSPSEPVPSSPAATDDAEGTSTTVVAAGAHSVEPTPGKRQLREAEDAYLAGAKKLERDDLNAAEQQFMHALKLDPENRSYAIAISVTR